MFSIQIELTGDKKALKHLKELDKEILDFSKEMKKIGQYIVDFIRNDVFASEGQVFGRPWPKLSTPYKWLKQKKFPGAGTLVATGAMQRAFKFKSAKTKVTISNPAKQFKYHQLGGPVIPKRVMIALDDTRMKKVVDILHDGLSDRIKKVYNK